MENSCYGTVIRVKDLEACRTFYRDIIGLGAPVMDSNIWVEFRLNDQVSLCLEKIDCNFENPPETDRVAVLFKVQNLETFSQMMSDYGYQEIDNSDRLGYQVKSYKDPEGNLFLVSELHSR